MFLCTLLIPDPILRTKVMTVRAFNTEVAIIRDQVSQKEIGLSRLVFWREAVNQLYLSKKADSSYKNVPRQPTVLGMSKVCSQMHNCSCVNGGGLKEMVLNTVSVV